MNYENWLCVERDNCLVEDYLESVFDFLNNLRVVSDDSNIQEGIKMISLIIGRSFERIFNSCNVDEQIGSLEWKKKMLLLEVGKIDKQIAALEKFSSDSLIKKRLIVILI